ACRCLTYSLQTIPELANHAEAGHKLLQHKSLPVSRELSKPLAPLFVICVPVIDSNDSTGQMSQHSLGYTIRAAQHGQRRAHRSAQVMRSPRLDVQLHLAVSTQPTTGPR